MGYLLGFCIIILLIAGLIGEFGVIGFVISAGILIASIHQVIKSVKNGTPGISMKDIDEMKGHDFEVYCAKILKAMGYCQVKVTPQSGDFGADIVAMDKKNQRWVFQCKRYASKLGNAPIQEIVAAKGHYRAVCAGVITNSTFTVKARQLAKENNVMLIEREQLARLIK